ncbi:MAG: PAS domain-containing protein, partial [Proteobacteria bacterium]
MQVDFKALFAVIQTPLLVLDRDMIIVAFNPAYSKATGIREAEAIGKSHFEVFPENPNDLSGNGRSVVRSSFEKVVRLGVADEMPLVKYDVPVPDSKTGEFDERFWKAVNSPVFGVDGSVTHILHYPEDVTLFVQMQNRNLKLQIGQQEIVALKLAQESQILERHKLEAIF